MTDYDTVLLGDEGTRIELEIQEDGVFVDISSASVTQIKLRKPGGAIITKTAGFVIDGTDGLIEYFTEAGIVDTLGLWSARGYVEIGSWKGHSTAYNFLVQDPEA